MEHLLVVEDGENHMAIENLGGRDDLVSAGIWHALLLEEI